ncbi:MAG TPA: ATP-binding protein [Rhizomicrobium sp.]|jgi:signal transduction histidine kinase|nr:ATP-binding protein [Rhizomicrobium sp.]
MSPRSELRVVTRYGAYFALAGVAILLVAGFFVSNYQDYLFRTQREGEITAQGSILAASVTAPVAFNDVETAREYVSALATNPEIEAAGIYDMRGTLFAGFNRARLPLPHTLKEAQARDGRLTVFTPIRQGALALGTVYLAAIEEPSERRFARYAAIMLLAIMAALFLAVMATAQRALRAVNSELEDRALALVVTNRRLETEMEERARAEEALRQSQKMEAVGQLSGGVAHDFNNLLTIIKGSLHMLTKRLAQGSNDVQRYVDTANEGIERAAMLTRRLLAFSRRQPLSPSPVSLTELASGMAEMVRHSAGERVTVDYKLDSTWKTVCDANLMENVILNLAINARDAMPDGGTLTIVTRDVRADRYGHDEVTRRDHVELCIHDTGFGMTDDVRARAFDPFFTTKPHGQGTGLGLAMAFSFIRQSGGTMRIESAPGRGTRVLIGMIRLAEEGAR